MLQMKKLDVAALRAAADAPDRARRRPPHRPAIEAR